VLFLIVAIINVAVFETRQGKRILEISGKDETPASFKIADAVSLASWAAVLYFGRMLPFLGNAF